MGKSARRGRGGKSVRKQQRKLAGVAVPQAELEPREVSPEVLDRLWAVVRRRREADPAISHSARLLSRGVGKVAQKFGEEAVECVIEGVAGNRGALISESADVLYHLIVLWGAVGLRPEKVWAELVRREGISGLAEKASRATGKVP